MLHIPVPSNTEAGTPVPLEACLEATFADQVIEGFDCPQCNAKTNVIERKRFISFPRNIAMCLKRIVFDDWVPKKLEIALQTDIESAIDLSRFGGGTGELKPGEEGFPQPAAGEEPDMIEPEVDMNMVNQLIMNGIPELAAKHAVYNAGSSVDDAAMWFYGNIENPICETPLLVPNPRKGAGGQADSAAAGKGGFVADPESLMMIVSMGFTEQQATRGLRKCDGNLERAMDFIMSHMDEPDSDDDAGMAVDEGNQAPVVSKFAETEANQNVSTFKM